MGWIFHKAGLDQYATPDGVSPDPADSDALPACVPSEAINRLLDEST